VLVVTAPEETLLARICARDGISRAAAQQRLAAQLPEAELVRRADYVLHNDTVPADAVRQAQAVFALLRKEP
jgi:dephospho-CoA kinase